jgi:hypothetical protein
MIRTSGGHDRLDNRQAGQSQPPSPLNTNVVFPTGLHPWHSTHPRWTLIFNAWKSHPKAISFPTIFPPHGPFLAGNCRNVV